MTSEDGNFQIRELHSFTPLFQVTFSVWTQLLLISQLGLWCSFIISTNTDLFWDLNLYDSRVQTMACCSFGYFIYDSFSMIKHNGLIQSYDILLHHLIVFGKHISTRFALIFWFQEICITWYIIKLLLGVSLLDLPMRWPILLSISEWSWKCLVVTPEIQGKHTLEHYFLSIILVHIENSDG